PDTLNAIKGVHAFGQDRADDHADVSTGDSLVATLLAKPITAPAFCALALPEDGPGLQAVGSDNLVNDISTIQPFWDRLNQITGERSFQHGFKFKLLDFPLKLLRSLFALASEFFDLLLHVG